MSPWLVCTSSSEEYPTLPYASTEGEVFSPWSFFLKLLKNTICTIMSEFLRIFNSVYFLFQSLGWLYAIAIYVYQRWIIVEVGKLLCSYSSRSQLVPEASGFENKLLAYLNSVPNCQHLTASGKKANPWKCQGAHKENQKAEMIH